MLYYLRAVWYNLADCPFISCEAPLCFSILLVISCTPQSFFYSCTGPITPQGTGFLAVQMVGGIKVRVRHQYMLRAQEQPGPQLQSDSPVQQPHPDERLPVFLGLILSYFPSGQFPHRCHRSGSGPGQISCNCEEAQTDWIPL